MLVPTAQVSAATRQHCPAFCSGPSRIGGTFCINRKPSWDESLLPPPKLPHRYDFHTLLPHYDPSLQAVRNLVAARLAADVAGTPTVLIARTDAHSANLLTSDVDERDRPFCTGKRTPEGFFYVNCGVKAAIARALVSWVRGLLCSRGQPLSVHGWRLLSTPAGADLLHSLARALCALAGAQTRY